MDFLQSLLALMTPIGLALFALVIVREGQKDRAAENERRDKREASDRDQRAKDWQQFMLLLAAVTNKQDVSTAQVVKSSVDSEARVSNQLTSAETNIKGRISTGADANAAAFEKVYKLFEAAAQIALARPPDPMMAIRYDKALEVLTAQMEAVKDDLVTVKSDVASNTDAIAATNETGLMESAA